MGFESLLGVNPWTALFTLANTTALFLVLKKYLFGPVLKIVEERRQQIDELYTKAGQAKEQAAALRTAYADKLSAADEAAERVVREAVARGQRREEEILRQANAQADAIRRKADTDIHREKEKAVTQAKEEISVIAMAIATKAVGRVLTDADQVRLADRFIEDLDL